MNGCASKSVDAATCALIGKFIEVIVNPILILLFAVAGLVFLWGVIEYLYKLRGGENTQDGRKHMFYGLLGLFIIVSTVGIINIISATVKGFF